jgi:hypothetical protein
MRPPGRRPKGDTAVRSTEVRLMRRWAVPKVNTAVRNTEVA